MYISDYKKAKPELIDEAIIKTAILSEWLIKVRNNVELVENIGEIEFKEIYENFIDLSLILFGIVHTQEQLNEMEKRCKP